MSRPLSALSVRPARARGQTTAILGFTPPRTTVLAFAPDASPARLGGALRRIVGADTTIVLAEDADLEGFRHALSPALVLLCPAQDVLRFLWFYRDEHDPLALGHASERWLLDERYPGRRIPDLGTGDGRAEALELVRQMATMLGLRLPLPAPGRRGEADLTAFLEGCLGLYAALLFRWGAPIALLTDGGKRLVLADEWLRERREIER